MQPTRSKKFYANMASNLLVTAFLLAITIVFKLRIFDPHIRGFYCDDETIGSFVSKTFYGVVKNMTLAN